MNKITREQTLKTSAKIPAILSGTILLSDMNKGKESLIYQDELFKIKQQVDRLYEKVHKDVMEVLK